MFSLKKLDTRLYPAIIRMCRISDIGGEDGIIAATLFRKIGETHDDENVVVQKNKNVEENLQLDPYEQTHSHEIAIMESNSTINHHKKLLLDPKHIEETDSNQQIIERHEHAIKIHEVFLKKVQV